jgi:hypothetical protein
MEVADASILIASTAFLIGLLMWIFYFPWRFRRELMAFGRGESQYQELIPDILSVILYVATHDKKLKQQIRGVMHAYSMQAAGEVAKMLPGMLNKIKEDAMKQYGIQPQQGQGGQMDIMAMVMEFLKKR